MATNPPEGPDKIEPQSPPETKPPLTEPPAVEPDEVAPLQPDIDQPSRNPSEVPDLSVSEL